MTIDAYVRAKQIALAEEISPRRKVYLDLNYWITLRDAALGLRSDAPALSLLNTLRRGVGSGRLICPIGDNVFMELMKQPFSDDRRIGMASLVDELSLGVSFLVSDRRIGTEIYIALHELLDRPGVLHPMQDLIWTKVCYIVGESYPVIDGLDPADLLALQKGVVDDLWSCTFEEMIRTIGDSPHSAEKHRVLSEETNRDRDIHADEITSFARAYQIELRGGLGACGHLAADALCAMAEADGIPAPARGSPAWREMETVSVNMVHQAFQTRKAAEIVRTLHVETALHAAMRVDKARRFKPNDFYDFRHAAAALAYCDAFFTDSPLYDLVSRKQLGLLGLNNCRVATALEDADVIAEALASVVRRGGTGA